jgi:hypothetical protein
VTQLHTSFCQAPAQYKVIGQRDRTDTVQGSTTRRKVGKTQPLTSC